MYFQLLTKSTKAAMNFGTKANRRKRVLWFCVSPQVKEKLAPCNTSLKTMDL